MNQVLTGDCLSILQQQPDHLVDLVYLDPPFFTQKTHSLKTRNSQKEYSFVDEWESLVAYLEFLRVRLVEMRRVMKPTATLFFHCDKSASHHIRLLLDEIFGAKLFLSEIIWMYRRWSNARKGLLNAHQTIFMYAKTADFTFNRLFQDYSETTNLDQILQKRKRAENNKVVYAQDENGDIILNGAKKGVPLSDVWEIPFLNPKAAERAGYPTQKPLLLLERIIQLASNPGDLVLDPFCGSGTTLVAASLLDRRYCGIDISSEAVALTLDRLANPVRSDSALLNNGREAYDNLPPEVKTILAGLPVKPVQRNAGIDAIYDHFIEDRPVILLVQRDQEALSDAAEKLLRAGEKMRAAAMILIQTSTHINPAQTMFFSQEDTLAKVMVVPSLHFEIQQALDQLTEKSQL